VAAKLEFDPSLSVAELAAAINGCEARVRAAVPIARLIYLEPDLSAAPDRVADSGAAPRPAD